MKTFFKVVFFFGVKDDMLTNSQLLIPLYHMRIIAKKTLRDFWGNHAKSRKDLEEWYYVACKAIWLSPNDVKQIFPKASIIPNNRVVFDIVRGNFRLVVKFAYKTKIGYIRFIGTHNDYDKIDVSNI